jgi:hypothetical protein
MADDEQLSMEEIAQQLSGDGESFFKEAVSQVPQLREIAEKVAAGEMGEGEAINELLSLASDPRTAINLARVAQEHMEEDPRLFHPPHEGAIPTLNPLFAAELAERLQFDGDIPELRTAPLPLGQKPAVPVETSARNPVYIGMLLQRASEEVGKHLALATEHRLALPEDVEEGAALVPGYKTGEVPARRKVAKPSGAAVATMSEGKRKEMAWGFITTTQGRRSAVPTITEGVLAFLSHEDYLFELDPEFDPGEDLPVAEGEWTIQIQDGDSSCQPNFSFLDAAQRSLCRQLQEELPREAPRGPLVRLTLVVGTVDDYKRRRVGWNAHLYKA